MQTKFIGNQNYSNIEIIIAKVLIKKEKRIKILYKLYICIYFSTRYNGGFCSRFLCTQLASAMGFRLFLVSLILSIFCFNFFIFTVGRFKNLFQFYTFTKPSKNMFRMYLRSIVNIPNVYRLVYISINVKEEDNKINETQPSTCQLVSQSQPLLIQ
jgi:hypothetical protein